MGWTYDKISKSFFIDKKTISNYKRRFLDYDIEGLINDSHDGKLPLLTDEEKMALEEHLKNNHRVELLPNREVEE